MCKIKTLGAVSELLLHELGAESLLILAHLTECLITMSVKKSSKAEKPGGPWPAVVGNQIPWMICHNGEVFDSAIYPSPYRDPVERQPYGAQRIKRPPKGTSRSSSVRECLEPINKQVLKDDIHSLRKYGLCIRRSRLEEDVGRLQARLKQEQNLHSTFEVALSCAAGGPFEISSRFPNDVQELLKDIAEVEVTVSGLAKEIALLKWLLEYEHMQFENLCYMAMTLFTPQELSHLKEYFLKLNPAIPMMPEQLSPDGHRSRECFLQQVHLTPDSTRTSNSTNHHSSFPDKNCSPQETSFATTVIVNHRLVQVQPSSAEHDRSRFSEGTANVEKSNMNPSIALREEPYLLEEGSVPSSTPCSIRSDCCKQYECCGGLHKHPDELSEVMVQCTASAIPSQLNRAEDVDNKHSIMKSSSPAPPLGFITPTSLCSLSESSLLKSSHNPLIDLREQKNLFGGKDFLNLYQSPGNVSSLLEHSNHNSTRDTSCDFARKNQSDYTAKASQEFKNT